MREEAEPYAPSLRRISVWGEIGETEGQLTAEAQRSFNHKNLCVLSLSAVQNDSVALRRDGNARQAQRKPRRG